jgi:hypothetical protein
MLLNTPNSTKTDKNERDLISTTSPPHGFHYWGTAPKLLSDTGKPTKPLRPNSNLSRSQEYIDLYCKTDDVKLWLCCVVDCNQPKVKMSVEISKSSGEQTANFYNFFLHLQRHHVHLLRQGDRSDIDYQQSNESNKKTRTITSFLCDSPVTNGKSDNNKLTRQIQQQAKLEIKMIRTNIINAFVKVIATLSR